jgi:hypothetical protein
LDQIAMFFSPDVTKETARRAARYAVAHLTRWSREISLDAETNRITV